MGAPLDLLLQRTMAQEKPKNDPVTKLMIDRADDFKYHVAYMAYSKAWDENTSEETRRRLNEIMSSLTNSESSYSNFYRQLNQYRVSMMEFPHRSRIQSQRKGEWRRGEARKSRNYRYRK